MWRIRIQDKVPFDPGIRDPDPEWKEIRIRIRNGNKSGSGMNISDQISESLETIFWVKKFKLFDADPDPRYF